MIYLKLTIILSLIIFLNKRSENTTLVEPSLLLSHRPCLTDWFHCFISPRIFYLHWITLQIIKSLLNIGGVETNPGPAQMTNLHDDSRNCKRCLLPSDAHTLECTLFYQIFNVNQINLPLFTYHYIFEAKGLFTFICENCCDAGKEQQILTKYTQSITDQDDPSNQPYNQTPHNYAPPLLSLSLRPPPSFLLHKWWHILKLKHICRTFMYQPNSCANSIPFNVYNGKSKSSQAASYHRQACRIPTGAILNFFDNLTLKKTTICIPKYNQSFKRQRGNSNNDLQPATINEPTIIPTIMASKRHSATIVTIRRKPVKKVIFDSKQNNRNKVTPDDSTKEAQVVHRRLTIKSKSKLKLLFKT